MNSNWKNKLIVTGTSRNQETHQFINNSLINLFKCLTAAANQPRTTTEERQKVRQKSKKTQTKQNMKQTKNIILKIKLCKLQQPYEQKASNIQLKKITPFEISIYLQKHLQYKHIWLRDQTLLDG